MQKTTHLPGRCLALTLQWLPDVELPTWQMLRNIKLAPTWQRLLNIKLSPHGSLCDVKVAPIWQMLPSLTVAPTWQRFCL